MRNSLCLAMLVILTGCSNPEEKIEDALNTPGYFGDIENPYELSEPSDNEPTNSDTPGQIDSPEVTAPPVPLETTKTTHSVCAFSENDDEALIANYAINGAEEVAFIDSMIAIQDNISTKQDQWPDTSDIDVLLHRLDISLGASMLASASLFDAINGFYYGYICTEEEFSLTQCNWTVDPFLSGDDGKITVETIHGDNKHFSTTVNFYDDGIAETDITIDGVIGHAGTVTMNFFDEGLLELTRTSIRSENGFESVEYVFDDGSVWQFSENSDCSGSADITSVSEDETRRVTSTWSYDGSVTTGHYLYSSTSLDEDIVFQW